MSGATLTWFSSNTAVATAWHKGIDDRIGYSRVPSPFEEPIARDSTKDAQSVTPSDTDSDEDDWVADLNKLRTVDYGSSKM